MGFALIASGQQPLAVVVLVLLLMPPVIMPGRMMIDMSIIMLVVVVPPMIGAGADEVGDDRVHLAGAMIAGPPSCTDC